MSAEVRRGSPAGWFGLAIVAALGAGCAGTPAPVDGPSDARLVQLARVIERLDASVDRAEAQSAAHEALQATAELTDAYRMTSPPLLHNIFVNVGFRDRGLCCHWAEDLVARLVALELATLEVHWVVASLGDRLREHSSVLLVPNGLPYEHGVVLDGWRRAGELVWAFPGEDRYPWELHPLDGQWSQLRCR